MIQNVKVRSEFEQKLDLEEREYRIENSTAEDILRIKEKVFFIDKDILVIEELAHPTEFNQILFFEKMQELILPHFTFYLLIDLTKVKEKKNDSAHRDRLKKTFKYYRRQILHNAIAIEGNILIKLAAKIVMRGNVNSLSFHSNFSEARKKIEQLK
ncbi:MAG: hypothetical protein ABJF11_10890 [Reichenbachiella sp.]|uniref:hypothetical protein n=1 Tax=Reichenbachiella sp. TaxID=2184521 RepID=UPI0032637963